MQFDVSGAVHVFYKVAAIIFFSGAISISVGLYLRNMTKQRKLAFVNFTFVVSVTLGALIFML